MDSSFHDSVINELVADSLSRTLPEAPVALDLGCGDGSFGLSLLDRLPMVDMVFLDADAAALARVRQAKHCAVTVMNSGHTLPFDDQVFDLVVAAFVFHFHSLWPLLEAAHRVLRIGGRLLLTYYGGSLSSLLDYLEAIGFQVSASPSLTHGSHFLVSAARLF